MVSHYSTGSFTLQETPSFLAHVYVILCLRFSYVITSIPARLDMGGWFCLTQQGLAPCKKRQASWRTFQLFLKWIGRQFVRLFSEK
jgi:hypothetical protein